MINTLAVCGVDISTYLPFKSKRKVLCYHLFIRHPSHWITIYVKKQCGRLGNAHNGLVVCVSHLQNRFGDYQGIYLNLIFMFMCPALGSDVRLHSIYHCMKIKQIQRWRPLCEHILSRSISAPQLEKVINYSKDKVTHLSKIWLLLARNMEKTNYDCKPEMANTQRCWWSDSQLVKSHIYFLLSLEAKIDGWLCPLCNEANCQQAGTGVKVMW